MIVSCSTSSTVGELDGETRFADPDRSPQRCNAPRRACHAIDSVELLDSANEQARFVLQPAIRRDRHRALTFNHEAVAVVVGKR